jgi:general secretion pathway protein G
MKKAMQRFLLALLTFIIGLGLIAIISRPYVERECRETVLKQDLHAMRKAIDQYISDKEIPPQSLNDLVKQGYIREIPPDPISNEKDWRLEFGETTGSGNGDYGIVDVHSSAAGMSASGTPFNEF